MHSASKLLFTLCYMGVGVLQRSQSNSKTAITQLPPFVRVFNFLEEFLFEQKNFLDFRMSLEKQTLKELHFRLSENGVIAAENQL